PIHAELEGIEVAMINEITRERINALSLAYQRIAKEHSEALTQITLAELAESVQQSNEIENSTLTLEDTEQILAGHLPRGQHELREVYEARNLADVTEQLLASAQPLSIELMLSWHRTLLSGIHNEAAGRFRRADEWVRVGTHVGARSDFIE